MLQQSLVETISGKEAADPGFLTESDIKLIKKRLNTKEGVEFYDQYLGRSGKNQERSSKVLVFMLHLAVALLIVTALVLTCNYGVARLFRSKKQTQINFDCNQAILKKQRLE